MRVRWTDPAARDLTQICDYIQEHDSGTIARRVALSIYERVSTLMEFPDRGRPGRIKGTRELVLTGLPYILPSIASESTMWRYCVFFTVRRPGLSRVQTVWGQSVL